MDNSQSTIASLQCDIAGWKYLAEQLRKELNAANDELRALRIENARWRREEACREEACRAHRAALDAAVVAK